MAAWCSLAESGAPREAVTRAGEGSLLFHGCRPSGAHGEACPWSRGRSFRDDAESGCRPVNDDVTKRNGDPCSAGKAPGAGGGSERSVHRGERVAGNGVWQAASQAVCPCPPGVFVPDRLAHHRGLHRFSGRRANSRAPVGLTACSWLRDDWPLRVVMATKGGHLEGHEGVYRNALEVRSAAPRDDRYTCHPRARRLPGASRAPASLLSTRASREAWPPFRCVGRTGEACGR